MTFVLKKLRDLYCAHEPYVDFIEPFTVSKYLIYIKARADHTSHFNCCCFSSFVEMMNSKAMCLIYLCLHYEVMDIDYFV